MNIKQDTELKIAEDMVLDELDSLSKKLRSEIITLSNSDSRSFYIHALSTNKKIKEILTLFALKGSRFGSQEYLKHKAEEVGTSYECIVDNRINKILEQI